MNPLSPATHKFSAILFSLALLLTPLANLRAQERQQNARQQNAPALSPGALISSVAAIGSSLISPAARQLQGDPYAEFRGARYSNEGLVSERDEVRLGQQLHVEIGRRYELVPEGQARVNRIGARAARASQRPNLTYHFYVIRDKEINAFSGPGGYVYITTALLNLADDDELASVLSHEIGHVVARHSLKSMQASQTLGGLAGIFGSIAGIAGDTAGQLGTAAASIVASGLLASHSREEEREADYLGVHGVPRAGYNSQGMVTMFQKLQRISQTDRDLLGSLFASHPDIQERIDNTRYEINHMGSGTRSTRGRRRS